MATNTSDFFTFSKTAGTAKNLQKPTDGGDNNLWGGYINVDLDTIVGAVNATSDLIADANQNELVDFTATTDAVNHVGITNAAAGNGPTIEAKGDDTNIDLNVTPKGSGDSVFSNKIKVDDIIEKTTDHGVEIDGVLIKDGTISNNSADLTIASSADINLDANGADIKLKDNGVQFGTLYQSSGHLFIQPVSSKKIELKDQGGTTALTVETSDQNVTVNSGNLIIGTSGKGIDFSATGGGSGTSNESEILTDYEQGEWTPSGTAVKTSSAHTAANGRYTKIGNRVFVEGEFTPNHTSAFTSSNEFTIASLPFNILAASQGSIAGSVTFRQSSTVHASASIKENDASSVKINITTVLGTSGGDNHTGSFQFSYVEA